MKSMSIIASQLIKKQEKQEDAIRQLANRNGDLMVTVQRLTDALEIAMPYVRRAYRLDHGDYDELQAQVDSVKAAIEHGVCVLQSG